MTSTIAPILGGLFLVLAVGVVLRVVAKMGTAQADTLNSIIMDVTMPALIVSSLGKRELDWHLGRPLACSVVALFAAVALGFLVARLAGADKKAQGASLLTSAYANTGFLGFPLMLALYPAADTAAVGVAAAGTVSHAVNNAAASTAIACDTVDTTLLLWTVGLALAQRLGHGGGVDARATLRIFLRPLTVALVVAVIMGASHVALPAFLDHALASLGACTSPLVFLALGLQLDATTLKGRPHLLVLAAVVKLGAAPLVALVLVRLLHVDEPAASVVVFQAAMPSAMASVMVAARAGCDRALAAGVATLTTVLCVVSVPLWAWVMTRF